MLAAWQDWVEVHDAGLKVPGAHGAHTRSEYGVGGVSSVVPAPQRDTALQVVGVRIEGEHEYCTLRFRNDGHRVSGLPKMVEDASTEQDERPRQRPDTMASDCVA